jgi:hypothetical protein
MRHSSSKRRFLSTAGDRRGQLPARPAAPGPVRTHLQAPEASSSLKTCPGRSKTIWAPTADG